MKPAFAGKVAHFFSKSRMLKPSSPSLTSFLVACVLVTLVIAAFGFLPAGTPQFATIASLIAIFFSGYTLVRQRYASETTSWNTALMRLGQLYDQAAQHDDLARILSEPIDLTGAVHPQTISLSPRQDVWLANLFMAFEQIYVAIAGAGRESQRAWKRFLANQLNKPTIRTVFLRDAEHFDDYHQGFIEFACGKRLPDAVGLQCEGGAIAQDVISLALEVPVSIEHKRADVKDVLARPVIKNDLAFWKEMYSDPEVKRQMYAVPVQDEKSMLRYFQDDGKGAAFTVTLNGEPAGGFTIRKETPTRGTFGVLIHRPYRSQGLGAPIMQFLEDEARKMGLLTLRADVYVDNIASIRLLEGCGFRRFVWFEKNL